MPVPALPPPVVERLAADGAIVLDVREREAFAAGHLPGAVNVELGDGLAQYAGWVMPEGARVVVVGTGHPSEDAAATAEVEARLARAGSYRVVGRLLGGVDAWERSGRPVRRYPFGTMRELYDLRVGEGRAVPVLDVRAPNEWTEDGAIPDSELIFLADLPDRLSHDGSTLREAAEPWWVVCTTGVRATVAASLLDAAGIPVRLVGRGGVIGWVERFEAAARG